MKYLACILLLTGGLAATPAAAQTALTNTFNDLAGTWDGTNQVQLEDQICVAASTGGYSVTITGSGASSAFTVASGAKTIAYTVEFKDATKAYATVTSNVPMAGFTTGRTNTTSCSGANAAAFYRVTLSPTNLAAATAGTYTGTVTVRITPQ